MIFERRNFINKNKKKSNFVSRADFNCIKVILTDEDDLFKKTLKNKSLELYKKMNPGEANSSEKRDNERILTDVLSGLLAEHMVVNYLKSLKGETFAKINESTSSKNQIDISLEDSKKIEVRSSFVYGFPNIPLFHLNKNPLFDGHQSYNIPCKYIFNKMNLQYAPVDGNLQNCNNEIVSMNSTPSGVLIRKKDFIQFLDANNLDIVWTLLGEKFSFDNNQNEESYFKVPCGVYYLENSELKGEIKMYDRN